jgi:hypothetical protein
LYQPFESAERDSPTELLGDEASYANGSLVALVVLPALSVQLPLTVPVVESGPEYVVFEHDPIPETELAETNAVTGLVYQPSDSGGGRPTETAGPEPS